MRAVEEKKPAEALRASASKHLSDDRTHIMGD
jgi:hypothetical protein